MSKNNNFEIDSKSNHHKNVSHGFFMALGMTIAEAHTILPLIVAYFGGGAILVGLFSSLLRGGAILVQLYAAFHAQGYPLVLKYLQKVFFIRFLSWFLIGMAILIFGNNYPTLTLVLIGIGLFIFS
ncbi:MAG: MFS transporter, partial [Campylobacterota bacterium]|nr:MFS transporter [Campylobacterota bacterium]